MTIKLTTLKQHEIQATGEKKGLQQNKKSCSHTHTHTRTPCGTYIQRIYYLALIVLAQLLCIHQSWLFFLFIFIYSGALAYFVCLWLHFILRNTHNLISSVCVCVCRSSSTVFWFFSSIFPPFSLSFDLSVDNLLVLSFALLIVFVVIVVVVSRVIYTF